jgi:hypothetical protein
MIGTSNILDVHDMKHINHNEIPPKQTIKRRRITTMIITYVNYYERELSSLQSFFYLQNSKRM